MLSPQQRAAAEEEDEAEDVTEGTFEVDLLDAGVPDEDIISLRRVEARLSAEVREVPPTPNVRTRAQAEAALHRAKAPMLGDPEQDRLKYKVMLK